MSVDPGSNLWRVFSFLFVPPLFFLPSLFQLDYKSWHGFNPYQIPSFLSLVFFTSLLFSLFCTFFQCLPPLFPCLSSFFLSPILLAFLFFLFLLLLVPFFFPFLLLFFLSLSSNHYSVTVLVRGSHMHK